MAMYFGRKFILQIPRSIVAAGTGRNSRLAGTGGNLRLSSGLAGAPRPNTRSRPRPRPRPIPKYLYDRPPLHVTVVNDLALIYDLLPTTKMWIALFCGLWWLDLTLGGAVHMNTKSWIKVIGDDMKKKLEEKGVSGQLWEAKTAELKRKIKSGSASED